MYIQRSGMGGILDIFTGIGDVASDWIKRQIGLPTSIDERARAMEQKIKAEQEIASKNIVMQAQMQKYMIFAGAGIMGIGLIAFILSMKRGK